MFNQLITDIFLKFFAIAADLGTLAEALQSEHLKDKVRERQMLQA